MSRIIMGVDPGSLKTGFACVLHQDGKVYLKEEGVLVLKGSSLAERLNQLSQGLSRIFSAHAPEVMVLERIFLSKNVDSAFKLGHARGVCLQKGQEFGAECVELSPRQVKKSIAGHGGAAKAQLELILRRHFALKQALREDASDALALAIAHLRRGKMNSKLIEGMRL